ncbi:cell division protein FtsQ/DivIB [Aerococcaceae bacterium WGS1372]
MTKDYRSGNYRIDYESNREDIKFREKQVENPSRGNYRIDSQGNPIIKQVPDYTSQEELEQDYFSRSLKDTIQFENYLNSSIPNNEQMNQSSRNERQQIYQFQDYYRRENEINHRMRQPNRREYQTPQRMYVSTRYGSSNKRSPNTQSPIRNHYQKGNNHNQSWYYRFHQRMNKRSQTASQAKLPKGRTALFAVFSMIYIIMIVCGWQLMPFIRVNNLSVSGNELVPESFIKSSSRILSYDKVDEVLKQREAIEEVIKEENPMVESIAFTRPNWKVLEINVAEHDIVGLINNDGYHPVLSNGTIIDASSNQELATIANESLPELINFNTSGDIAKVAEGLRQINGEILAQMETITKVDDPNKPNAILVQMKDGNQVRAISSTFAQKVQYYPEILSQLEGARGTINFEVGAYFTPDVVNANSIKLDNN